MRLADKRFRGPDREPWDPQRALTLGLRCGDVCSHSHLTTFADTLSTCDIEMDKSMYWVPALMYEGTPCRPAHLSGSRHERRARTLSDRPYGPRSMIPDT
jgi:hypothetical protein